MAIKNFQGALKKPEKAIQNILVKDYMSKNVITFHKSDCIYDVMRELLEKKISGAPVLNKSGKLVGIISESDIMKNIVESQYYNMPIAKTNISKYMTKSVDYITPDITIFEAASEFLKLKRKRFPVIVSDKIIGILSRIDIISASLSTRSQMWKKNP
ncbi:MAG: CBS domain-containing protein [Flavobacteriales bacterium]|jgi:predicted transcriptional regulator|tara:strand:- start:2670 stop:3140 length:471 start_codon:yes stop_codon:yes gene_type:complete